MNVGWHRVAIELLSATKTHILEKFRLGNAHWTSFWSWMWLLSWCWVHRLVYSLLLRWIWQSLSYNILHIVQFSCSHDKFIASRLPVSVVILRWLSLFSGLVLNDSWCSNIFLRAMVTFFKLFTKQWHIAPRLRCLKKTIIDVVCRLVVAHSARHRCVHSNRFLFSSCAVIRLREWFTAGNWFRCFLDHMFSTASSNATLLRRK